MAKRFMVSENGDLLNISDFSIVQKHYKYHFREIKNVSQLLSVLRAGRYTFPGGYEVYGNTSDGGCLCLPCIRKNLYSVAYSVAHEINDGWRVVGLSSSCENDYRTECDHCGYLLVDGFDELAEMEKDD